MARTPETITIRGYLVLEASRSAYDPDRVVGGKLGKVTTKRPRTSYPDQAVLELEVTVPLALFTHPPILVSVEMPEPPQEAHVELGEAKA